MNWKNTEYNNGVSVNPWGTNGFYVDAPGQNGTLNCIQSNRPGYQMGKHIVIRYYIHLMSGSPKFMGWQTEEGGLAPNFRPMLTRGGILDHRWYPSGINCGFLTAFDQAFTVSIPLVADEWQDVNGHSATQNLDDFRDTVTNGGSVCIVFGWHNYFAHGVYVQGGHARFGLWDYRVL